MAEPDTQNTAGTDGETGLIQVAQVPAGQGGSGAADRGATWHLDGRFVYRNKHGAVGYVDGPDSNPGLLALLRVTGPRAEAVAAKVHAALIAEAAAADMHGSYVLVPLEPTRRMLEAGHSAYAQHEWDAGRAKRGPERETLPIAFRAMLLAAREAEPEDVRRSEDPGATVAALRDAADWLEVYCPHRYAPHLRDAARMLTKGQDYSRARGDDDPSTIAQELEDAAFHASPRRASTYRRLAAVLREPGFGEVRS